MREIELEEEHRHIFSHGITLAEFTVLGRPKELQKYVRSDEQNVVPRDKRDNPL